MGNDLERNTIVQVIRNCSATTVPSGKEFRRAAIVAYAKMNLFSKSPVTLDLFPYNAKQALPSISAFPEASRLTFRNTLMAEAFIE